MTFLSPFAFLLFALSLPLVMLYFLKVRRRERHRVTERFGAFLDGGYRVEHRPQMGEHQATPTSFRPRSGFRSYLRSVSTPATR